MTDRSLDEARPETTASGGALTRRRFVGGAGAVVGAAAAVPALVSLVVDRHDGSPFGAAGNGGTASASSAIDMPAGVIDLTTPVVVHISDPAKGEVTVFVGESAHVFTDPDLVARVMRVAS